MNLIQDTLELIRSRLNGYFQVAFPSPDDWVVLSNLMDLDGQVVETSRNTIVIFLANIQQDNTISTWKPSAPTSDTRFAITAPTLYINLSVLFYANFSAGNYPQGLGMISQTIQFFQQNPVFDHQNLPDLPPAIDKLAFEFTNLEPVGLNYLMGLAGVKYLPSVYYKLRMIPFYSQAIQQQSSAVQGYQVPGEPLDPRNQSPGGQ
jgi:hypothetical protein